MITKYRAILLLLFSITTAFSKGGTMGPLTLSFNALIAMKKYILFISVLLCFSFSQFCFGQLQSMGFTQPIVTPKLATLASQAKPQPKMAAPYLARPPVVL